MSQILVFLVLGITTILSINCIFTICWMLYAWEDPETAEKHKSPKLLYQPHYSFTALIPARHETDVIEDTIKTLDKIDYPEELKETIILCRQDDIETIDKVNEIINKIGKHNIKLVVFDGYPINKPTALNFGLAVAKGEIVGVFDAEDEPNKDIYKIINTVMIKDKVDVVQSGVQLMNYNSHWFAPLNVLEYYFWFKSGLLFFLKIGKVMPMGGNTTFIKKTFLKTLGGWEKNRLTEDIDISFRLLAIGAKFNAVYDESHTTHEETPLNTGAFIKQRTRWNQGFLQVFSSGTWTKLPSLKQKLFALYILLLPSLQALFTLYIPFGLWIGLTHKMPIILALFAFFPFYLFLLQSVIYMIGMYMFVKDYNLKFSIKTFIKLLISFIPYQFILVLAALRALLRTIFKKDNWEKTTHHNDHRKTLMSILF